MTPAELQQLLVTRAPGVPGITAATPREDENPYGLTATVEGSGRAWWTITGASPVVTAQDSGPAGEDPVPVPDLTSRPVPVANVEQALIALALAHADGQVCGINRYSTRPDPPASAMAPPSPAATAGSCSCPATAPPAPASRVPTTLTTQPATSSPPGQPRDENQRVTKRNNQLPRLRCVRNRAAESRPGRLRP